MGLVKRDAHGRAMVLHHKGGGKPSKVKCGILGKLAVGLVLVCLYVAGTNVVLLTSVQNNKARSSDADANVAGDILVPALGSNSNKNKNKNARNASARSRRDGDSHAGNGGALVEINTTKQQLREGDETTTPKNSNGTSKDNAKPKKEDGSTETDASTTAETKKSKPQPALPSKSKGQQPKKNNDGASLRSEATYTCSYGPHNNSNKTRVVVPKGAPSLILIGVQKSGSTALLSHFRDHPQMLQSKLSYRREAHFFDTRWLGEVVDRWRELGLTQANDKHCLALEQYMRLFECETILANSQTMGHGAAAVGNTTAAAAANASPDNETHHVPLYTFDKTPSYFAHPKAAVRAKRTVPWAKIVLMLRNPVDRLYSQYKMTVKTGWDLRGYSLEDFVYHEIKAMRSYNMTRAPLLVPFYNETTTGTNNNNNDTTTTTNNKNHQTVPADRYEIPAHDDFDSDHAIDPGGWKPSSERAMMKTDDPPRALNKHQMVRRGMYDVQLRWWLKFYTVGEDLLVVNYEDLVRDTRAVYEQVLGFAGIPLPYNRNLTSSEIGIDFRQRVRADNDKKDRPLHNETRRYLEQFYQPYVAGLEELLGPDWNPSALGWWD